MKTISKHLPDFEDLWQKSLQDAAFPLYIAIDENRLLQSPTGSSGYATTSIRF
jgi:hypothetical protein